MNFYSYIEKKITPGPVKYNYLGKIFSKHNFFKGLHNVNIKIKDLIKKMI